MYYTTKEVMEILGVSVNTARKYMKQINDELESQGIITLKGKVPKGVFNERFCING